MASVMGGTWESTGISTNVGVEEQGAGRVLIGQTPLMSRLARGYENITKHTASNISCIHRPGDSKVYLPFLPFVQSPEAKRCHDEAPGRRGNVESSSSQSHGLSPLRRENSTLHIPASPRTVALNPRFLHKKSHRCVEMFSIYSFSMTNIHSEGKKSSGIPTRGWCGKPKGIPNNPIHPCYNDHHILFSCE